MFERLFGDGGSAGAAAGPQNETRAAFSIPSTQEVARLANTLGAGDRTKLSEYLDSVREIEQRIQNAEAQGRTTIELPDRPHRHPGDVRRAHAS